MENYYDTCLKMIWHGEWADPEITDGNRICNYWTFENSLYAEFVDEYGKDDPNAFDEWMKDKHNCDRAEELFNEIAE